jgi:hypothetical protein
MGVTVLVRTLNVQCGNVLHRIRFNSETLTVNAFADLFAAKKKGDSVFVFQNEGVMVDPSAIVFMKLEG